MFILSSFSILISVVFETLLLIRLFFISAMESVIRVRTGWTIAYGCVLANYRIWAKYLVSVVSIGLHLAVALFFSLLFLRERVGISRIYKVGVWAGPGSVRGFRPWVPALVFVLFALVFVVCTSHLMTSPGRLDLGHLPLPSSPCALLLWPVIIDHLG